MLRPFSFLSTSSSKIYKKEEDDVDEAVNASKSGLFYSPPKPKFSPPEGRGRANTSGSDSSITKLIIPEEDSDVHLAEQPEGKYSNRDARHGTRHKHKRHQERSFKGGEIFCRSVLLVPFLNEMSDCKSEFWLQFQTSLKWEKDWS